MPELPPSDQEFSQWVYRRLEPRPEEPILPESEFYVPLYPPDSDHVTFMCKRIMMAGTKSVQMFSGCNGSGKTTELRRLQSQLEKIGYLTFRVESTEYLNTTDPISIVDLLLVLPAALSEAVAARYKEDFVHEGYTRRLWNYLAKTEITLEEFGIKGPDDFGGPEFKAKLSTTPSFRQKLQQKLENRLQETKEQSEKFVEDIYKWLKAKNPQAKGVVLLFDQLEQIGDTGSRQADVMESVERLFINHGPMLDWGYLHLVYTVPPWLRHRAPGAVRLEKMLPCIKVRTVPPGPNGGDRVEAGFKALHEILLRRFTDAGLDRFFGEREANGERPLLSQLIDASGGHIRDLLLLAREAIIRAITLPIDQNTLDHVFNDIRRQYPVNLDDARWLKMIDETGDDCLSDNHPENVARFIRFLDLHEVLIYSNGEDLYAVHPLVREEVRRVLERAARLTSPPPPIGK
jgi:hypothetical protein